MEEKTNFNFDEVSEAVESTVKTKMSDLEGRLYIMVEEAVNRCEFSEADKKILKDTLNEVFALGQATEAVDKQGKELFADINKLFHEALDPDSDKYKRLYHHQHSVTSNLLSVATSMLFMLDIQEEKRRPPLAVTSLPCIGSAGM